MPTYDYECQTCGHKFEAFHSMSAEPLVDCPECLKPELIKLIGMGMCPIIKGTENPCTGGRGVPKKEDTSTKRKDKLGEGKFKQKEKPFWRDTKVNSEVLKNPKKYIQEGRID